MVRRITCIALVVGSVVTWKLDGGQQIVLAVIGLSFVPTLAVKPLISFINPGIAVLLWGLTACILIVVGPGAALAALVGWTCLCILDPDNPRMRSLFEAGSVSTGLLGLLLLIGRSASQAAEKPPPVGTALLVYSTSLIVASWVIWPWRPKGKRDRDIVESWTAR